MTKWWWEFLGKRFTEHVRIGPLTIYGANAMHFAVNLYVYRAGYICFKPWTWCFGRWWGPYLYLSRDATPSRAFGWRGENYRHEHD